jgi:hypothetical protein
LLLVAFVVCWLLFVVCLSTGHHQCRPFIFSQMVVIRSAFLHNRPSVVCTAGGRRRSLLPHTA